MFDSTGARCTVARWHSGIHSHLGDVLKAVKESFPVNSALMRIASTPSAHAHTHTQEKPPLCRNQNRPRSYSCETWKWSMWTMTQRLWSKICGIQLKWEYGGQHTFQLVDTSQQVEATSANELSIDVYFTFSEIVELSLAFCDRVKCRTHGNSSFFCEMRESDCEQTGMW